MVADPRIGTTLAGYRIEQLIGRCGMGSVYLAEHLNPCHDGEGRPRAGQLGPRFGRPRAAAAAAVALAILIGLGAVWSLRPRSGSPGSDHSSSPSAGPMSIAGQPNTVLQIDPANGSPTADIAVGTQPESVAFSGEICGSSTGRITRSPGSIQRRMRFCRREGD